MKCGGTFFNSQGSFTSPGYPGNYSPNMDCNFTITAPVGNKVKQDAFIILPNYWTSSFSKIVTQIKCNVVQTHYNLNVQPPLNLPVFTRAYLIEWKLNVLFRALQYMADGKSNVDFSKIIYHQDVLDLFSVMTGSVGGNL